MDPSLTFSAANPSEPNVTQLDFHQSMNHFKTMFPAIDEDVIETVLRANNGAVDATIDQLLQISSENQNSKPTNPPSYKHTMQSDINNLNLNMNSTPKEKVHKSTLKQMDLLSNQAKQQNNQLIDFDTIDAQSTAQSTAQTSGSLGRKSSKFNPPLVGSLPNDFLRIIPTQTEKISQQQSAILKNPNLIRQSSIPSNDHQINHQLLKKKMEENERQRLNSNLDDKEVAQYLEDERIALMLQNQEFVNELRRNKEFMSALNYDAMSHNTRVKGFHNENYASGYSGNYDNAQNFSDADFKERIKKMGEISKKKFAQLANLFSRGKGLVPSRDTSLLGDQYAQLENDYSDSEEYGQKKPVNMTKH